MEDKDQCSCGPECDCTAESNCGCTCWEN